MKIALFGYGKMGQLIGKMAKQRGHEIAVIFSRQHGCLQQSQEKLLAADIAIDFSHADCLFDNLHLCKSLNKSIVIGTTGWEASLPQVKELVENAQIGCLHSPNFSIGIHLFKSIVSHAAQLLSAFEDYDVSGIEYHHRHKADSPSGTAKALTQTLLQQMPLLKDFQFCSVRCGSIPGTHSLCFDSPVDTITLTHQARNREGFGQGALLAAEWLQGRRGFFALEDMLATSTLTV